MAGTEENSSKGSVIQVMSWANEISRAHGRLWIALTVICIPFAVAIGLHSPGLHGSEKFFAVLVALYASPLVAGLFAFPLACFWVGLRRFLKGEDAW